MVILLPARLEAGAASDEVRARLLRVAGALERYPLEEATRRIMEAEEAEGAFDDVSSARQTRFEALLRMNRDGIPHAIREVIDDPPVRDMAPIRGVTAPALVVGQEGDAIHSAVVARELADALPNAELIMFPDPGAMVREIPMLVARIAAFVTA
jgi:pimeloyl-ACP methyl ester carboxylesterase